MNGWYWSAGWERMGPICASLLLFMLLALAQEVAWTSETAELTSEAQQLRIAASKATLNRQALLAHSKQNPSDGGIALPEPIGQDGRLLALLSAGHQFGLLEGVLIQGPPLLAPDGVQRVEVSLRWRGSYAALRAAIEAALNADPHMSLDHLRVQRTNPESADLEAETVWSFFSRFSQRRRGEAQ